MLAVIEIEGPDSETRKLWISPGEKLWIGRTEEADVALAKDTALAPVHFALSCTRGECHVSAPDYPVLLNGHTVQQARLCAGDLIQAGRTRFRVGIEGITPTQPVAPVADEEFVPPGKPPEQQPALRFAHERRPSGLHVYRLQAHENVLAAVIRRLATNDPLYAVVADGEVGAGGRYALAAEPLFDWLPQRCRPVSPQLIGPIGDEQSRVLWETLEPRGGATWVASHADGDNLPDHLRLAARGQTCAEEPPHSERMLLTFEATVLEEVLLSADVEFVEFVFSRLRFLAFARIETGDWTLLSLAALDEVLRGMRLDAEATARAPRSLVSMSAAGNAMASEVSAT